jgi:hypothetical protein
MAVRRGHAVSVVNPAVLERRDSETFATTLGKWVASRSSELPHSCSFFSRLCEGDELNGPEPDVASLSGNYRS